MENSSRPPCVTTDADSLSRVVEALRAGGVVLLPTDTVYGLACAMDSAAGLDRIYQLKGHTTPRPYALLIADPEEARELWAEGCTEAEQMATLSWPGAVTVVAPKSARVPTHVSSGPNVGLRLPDLDYTRQVIRGLGQPIIATSANLTGQLPARALEDVPEVLLKQVDVVVEGGKIKSGGASKVIDASVSPPQVLRD